MSQEVYADIDPNVTSGTQLAGYLNDFKEALLTQHSGATAPNYTEIGTEWLDTSIAGKLIFKKYDGTQWISTFTIDSVAHSLALGGNNPVASISVTRSDNAADMIEVFRDTQVASTGGYIYSQRNDAAAKKTFAKIVPEATNVVNGAEESKFSFQTMDAGTLKSVMSFSKDSLFLESLKGTGKRKLVVDATGNVSAEADSQGSNLFQSGSAENADLGDFTATGLVLSKSSNAGDQIDGGEVFLLNASAAAQEMETPQIPVPIGYLDHPMIISMDYKAAQDWTVQVLDQDDNVLVTENINSFTPVDAEANKKKLFCFINSTVTSVYIKYISQDVGVLTLDNVSVYSWITTNEKLHFERNIANNTADQDLFLFASTKNKGYNVSAKITIETDTNYAEAINTFFVNYSSNSSLWSVQNDKVSDFENVETDVLFGMNDKTLKCSSGDIAGANYAGLVSGTIERIL